MWQGSLVTVEADGNMDIITLRRNGVDLESRRVPIEFLSTGGAAAPAQAAYKMVQEHPMYGSPFTVSWLGRGFAIVLK